ncbi:hypothetical protein P4N68_10170 [Corynebacterium felinum]|uniref:Uncharacterized membrane protein YobD (UPF0266 family) n=1 Tax=Corynebacterium felinum TaxID=131318 RepID=A0ABU2B617_9CORY|nr:hypothetical protein [Corynebacterium felinum]MDF5821437.1 hypothetical protein [Corynebacterium felinum]MDR7354061.1 uncharacterized membrane protein YobD (UPF0266 family) [Corynebacterium felinum]WJY96233.1 hypothetical protein CFELI_13270 [Corynebacterium felinum]
MKSRLVFILTPMLVLMVLSCLWAAMILPGLPSNERVFLGSDARIVVAVFLLAQLINLFLLWILDRFGFLRSAHAGFHGGGVVFTQAVLAFSLIWLCYSLKHSLQLGASSVVMVLGLAFLLALAVSYASAALVPRDTQDAEASFASDVSHVTSSATQWVSFAGFSTAMGVFLSVFMIGLFVFSLVLNIPFVTVTTVLVAVILVDLSYFHVRLDDTGFHYRALFGFPAKHIPLSKIHRISLTTVHIGDWGGWGFRGIGKKIGLITREGQGIQLDHSDDRILVVSCENASDAVAVFHNLSSPSPSDEASSSHL